MALKAADKLCDSASAANSPSEFSLLRSFLKEPEAESPNEAAALPVSVMLTAIESIAIVFSRIVLSVSNVSSGQYQ